MNILSRHLHGSSITSTEAALQPRGNQHYSCGHFYNGSGPSLPWMPTSLPDKRTSFPRKLQQFPRKQYGHFTPMHVILYLHGSDLCTLNSVADPTLPARPTAAVVVLVLSVTARDLPSAWTDPRPMFPPRPVQPLTRLDTRPFFPRRCTNQQQFNGKYLEPLPLKSTPNHNTLTPN